MAASSPPPPPRWALPPSLLLVRAAAGAAVVLASSVVPAPAPGVTPLAASAVGGDSSCVASLLMKLPLLAAAAGDCSDGIQGMRHAACGSAASQPAATITLSAAHGNVSYMHTLLLHHHCAEASNTSQRTVSGAGGAADTAAGTVVAADSSSGGGAAPGSSGGSAAISGSSGTDSMTVPFSSCGSLPAAAGLRSSIGAGVAPPAHASVYRSTTSSNNGCRSGAAACGSRFAAASDSTASAHNAVP